LTEISIGSLKKGRVPLMRELKVDCPGGFWSADEVDTLWKAANKSQEADESQDSSTLSTESLEQMCILIENYLISEVLKNNQAPEAVENIEAEVASA
jgi:hypothetical protein